MVTWLIQSNFKTFSFFWLKLFVGVSRTLWYLSCVFGSLEHSFRFCMQTWIIVTLRNLDTIYTWKGQNFLNLSKINTFIKIDNKFCKRLATEASNFDPDDMYKGLSIVSILHLPMWLDWSISLDLMFIFIWFQIWTYQIQFQIRPLSCCRK